MLERVALWAERVVASRPCDFTIGSKADPYLERWFVIPRNRWFNIYIHRFSRSDDDRALHDHPWWNVSWLLRGEYTEHTIDAGGVNVRTIYRAGDRKWRLATAAHRVELHAGQCLTLFITGPIIREWGFHCPLAGWRHWKVFTKPGEKGQIGPGCG
jgi:hypothetical protein